MLAPRAGACRSLVPVEPAFAGQPQLCPSVPDETAGAVQLEPSSATAAVTPATASSTAARAARRIRRGVKWFMAFRSFGPGDRRL